MTTSVDLTNRALAYAGTKSQITALNDGSAEALYANLLYNDLRDFLLREGDYDWSIRSRPLVAAASVLVPWNFTYVYPADCVRIRQLIPTTVVANDPQAVTWNTPSFAGSPTICTLIAVSQILYTSNIILEDNWDSMFTDAFCRLLASALLYALEQHVDFSKEKLQEAISFAGIANLRDS